MTISPNSNPKPGLVTAIAVMTLTSGIVNLFWGFVASLGVMSTVVGVLCVPVTILPTILGIFEVIYAAKLLSMQPQPIQPAQNLAAFEIAAFLFGNIFTMVVGILALVFYNDLVVKEYFAELNGTVPPSPAPVEEPIPAEPALPASEAVPAIEAENPEPEAIPEKPKRIRKVAGK